MLNKGLFSSNTPEWETPQDLFDSLNSEFGPFTLDPCSTDKNAKCHRHFTIRDDGLKQSWAERESQTKVFINPPYGREIGKWVEKAYRSVDEGSAQICVMLLPARTDTSWWHEYVMRGEVRFIRGRLKFGGSKNSAPFPSAIVIFKKEELK